jgi:hypothetical protein
VQGNQIHACSRVRERIAPEHQRRMAMAMKVMERRIKSKQVPNDLWWHPVYDNHNRVIGYIVGQGTWSSSILGPMMVPKGKKI